MENYQKDFLIPTQDTQAPNKRTLRRVLKSSKKISWVIKRTFGTIKIKSTKTTQKISLIRKKKPI